MDNPLKYLNRQALLNAMWLMLIIHLLRLVLFIFFGWDMPFVVTLVAPFSYLYWVWRDNKKKDNTLLNWSPPGKAQ